jgi:hypothetical protein
MTMSQESEVWSETAMAARNLARLLADEEAKAAWHRLAEECEAQALTAPWSSVSTRTRPVSAASEA